MILLYNLIQVIGLIVLSPILFVKIIVSAKYRGRIPARLGFGLTRLLADIPAGRPRIWVHALSVGEVTSALPLVKALRANRPELVIIFSAATMTGEHLALEKLHGQVDTFVPFPLDLYSSAKRFIHGLAPDLFILVETDFWPNFLHCLERENIPAILVNGRISEKSFASYQRFSYFFMPMFSAFTCISMQTTADAEKMISLGIAPDRIKPLGNLKYDAALPGPEAAAGTGLDRTDLGIKPDCPVWVAGSTHDGEEEIILEVHKRLLATWPDLFLVVAPRQVDRGNYIKSAAVILGIPVRKRSTPDDTGTEPASAMILDTIGELAATYKLADIAFIGGSLIPEGGHNPLEAAVFAKPVLFGPHMDDFTEIAADLVATGGARITRNSDELFKAMHELLADNALREESGRLAAEQLHNHQGVTARHLGMINDILSRDRQAPLTAPDRDRLAGIFLLGRPLAFIYGAIMIIRAWMYKTGTLTSHRLAARVISVGNLTMGGTGKTPLVMYIARYLLDKGRKPAIVSRGYGGRARRPVNLVSDGRTIMLEAVDSGDEPRLMAETLPEVPVLTGKKRAEVGRYAVERLGVDTIILDDGFQHLAVKRDLDLVLFNAGTMGPGSHLKFSRVLPGGELREPPGALGRADAFIIIGQDQATADNAASIRNTLKQKFPAKPVFIGSHRTVGLVNPLNGETLDIEKSGLYNIYGFCGIGDPESFRRTLRENQLEIVGFRVFKDHHAYSAADLAAMRKEAAEAGAGALVTTEKDMVKLRPQIGTAINRADLPVLSLRIELDPGEDFAGFLAEKLDT